MKLDVPGQGFYTPRSRRRWWLGDWDSINQDVDMNLVTGGTGLLGSHMAEQLRRDGQSVRALVRKGSDTAFLQSIGCELAWGDVTDVASVQAAMKGVRVAYHAAAQVGDWGQWSQFVAVTIEGTRNMLTAARDANIERFLHVSSISTYGHVNGNGLVLDETAPLGANLYKWAYYSRSKVEAEKLAWEFHRRGDVKLTVVKPSWLYGPRDRASMPRLIRMIKNGSIKLLGDGKNRLNLTHAASEANGCILAANSPKAVGEIYNLSDDGEITQEQYVNTIATLIGAKPVTRKVPYGLAYRVGFLLELIGHAVGRKKPPMFTRYSSWLMGRRVFFSCEKARRDLGWRPAFTYEDGLRDAVDWCQKNVGV